MHITENYKLNLSIRGYMPLQKGQYCIRIGEEIINCNDTEVINYLKARCLIKEFDPRKSSKNGKLILKDGDKKYQVIQEILESILHDQEISKQEQSTEIRPLLSNEPAEKTKETIELEPIEEVRIEMPEQKDETYSSIEPKEQSKSKEEPVDKDEEEISEKDANFDLETMLSEEKESPAESSVDNLAEPTKDQIYDAAKGIDYEDFDNPQKANDFFEEDVKLYISQIQRYRLLEQEEEIELAKRKDVGEEKAESTLINANLRLVVSIAKKYRNRGLEFMDLIQYGNIGLINGIRKYRPEKGLRVSTYVCWWIRSNIMAALGDYGRTVRLPRYIVERIIRVKKAIRKISENGEEITIEKIYEMTEIPKDSIKYILEKGFDGTKSLDEQIGEERTLKDTLQAGQQDFDSKLRHDKIRQLFKKLPEKQRRVIGLRFGLTDGTIYTLEDIGKHRIEGITEKKGPLTKERVRQIERKGLKTLMEWSSQIRDLLED